MLSSCMIAVDYYVRQLTDHQFICHNQPYIIIHKQENDVLGKKN